VKMLKTQARPYANALFELACEEDACAAWHAILSLLAAVVRDPEVGALLSVRSIEAEEWVKWIQSLKPDLLGRAEVHNFLQLLALRRRLFLLPDILNLFEAAWRKLKNEQRFTVIAPTKWDKAGSEQVRKFLSRRFDCQAEVTFERHSEMIGGLEILGDGWHLDYSVRGWLEQLRSQLIS
jgi:F-type H+-transporting ATPase subunit delta